MMEPSHSRNGATRHPVPLGRVRETFARPVTEGDSRRQITRHPGWHLMRGFCVPIPADKPRGSRRASKTNLSSRTLHVEYYDPNRSAQPTSAGLSTFSRNVLCVTAVDGSSWFSEKHLYQGSGARSVHGGAGGRGPRLARSGGRRTRLLPCARIAIRAARCGLPLRVNPAVR